jgi:hypothetical protein
MRSVSAQWRNPRARAPGELPASTAAELREQAIRVLFQPRRQRGHVAVGRRAQHLGREESVQPSR